MTALPNATLPLDKDNAAAAFASILDGEVSDEELAQFLTQLADRGETATEIAAAARAMRERLIPISGPENAIDVCGTGGDGQHSLNISTAVAIVIAAMDIPVAKHGNRAASSKAGAADTLEVLGLDLDRAAERAEASLNELNICFLFAAKHHPAMRHVMPVRKSLGRRTIFNLLGPLCNPAGVKRQLIGIASPALVPTYAAAISELGSEYTMVVSGEEGLDELSLAGGNVIAHVRGDAISDDRYFPADAGLEQSPLSAIHGGDAEYNAAALRALLAGEQSAYRDAVLFNAAAALMVAGEVSSLREGVEEAAETIDKGLAKALLDCWIAF